MLVEAYLSNLNATGLDINPLAVIISKAKTNFIPSSILLETLEIFDRIMLEVEVTIPNFSKNARIEYWFKPYTFEPLARLHIAIREVINRIDSNYREPLRNLLDCVYSRTVRDVSLTYRGEIRLRRLRDADYEKFNPDVLQVFKSKLNNTFSRIQNLPKSHKIPKVYEGDAKKIPAQDNEFDLVVTSPPYGDIKNTIPYHQFSKNMLYWLELGDEAIAKIRKAALGYPDKGKVCPPSDTLRQAINAMQKSNLIHEAVCFYADYYNALTEITRVTSQRIIIIIGHRILDGVLVNNPTITTELMTELGWILETDYKRNVRKKRLNRKMGYGNNAQGATIDTESILVYIPASKANFFQQHLR